LKADPIATGANVVVGVPRIWLIGLSVLFVVPWLIAAGIYAKGSWAARGGGAAAGSDTPEAAASAGRTSGPWGRLETAPIVISPPLEYVPTNWGPIEEPQWRFPRASSSDLEQFLSQAGLSGEQGAALLAATRPDPRIDGLVVSPDPDLVRQLAPGTRAIIYRELAKTRINGRHVDAYRHYAPTVDAWLGPGPVSAETVRLVEPYVYRIGDFVYFADIDLVRPQVTDAAQLQRLAKSLLREATLLVTLHLDDASRLDEIAEYWGRGGRRTDIRPLLESIVAGRTRWIDIGHLLPPFAREHLYRYPRVSIGDLERGALVNCFWTALNFFAKIPDDRFLDEEVAFAELREGYHIVHDELQLGDIAVFSTSSGEYFHAAVYLADGLVFGKNGNSSLAPWTILPIERLKSYYVQFADDWHVTYFRRNDL
jgi:hypothetical protein